MNGNNNLLIYFQDFNHSLERQDIGSDLVMTIITQMVLSLKFSSLKQGYPRIVWIQHNELNEVFGIVRAQQILSFLSSLISSSPSSLSSLSSSLSSNVQ